LPTPGFEAGPLGGAEGLLEALSFKEAMESMGRGRGRVHCHYHCFQIYSVLSCKIPQKWTSGLPELKFSKFRVKTAVLKIFHLQ